MSDADGPTEVVRRLLSGIANGEWAALHQLFSADAVVEYPFGLPEPSRLEGREALCAYFAGVARAGLSLIARDIVVHLTADPEVVIVEWTYDGTNTATGQTFEAANITVSRVREGRICASRDYHNHLVLAEAAGRLDRVLAARTAGRA